MNVLDLFSGIGGFSLGLERAGFKTIAFCEIDPFCRTVLKKHWPQVPCYEDVTKLTASHLADRVDLICGGFPCQDISVAGKGAGIDGTRSGLWSEYARIIGEVRPRYVIVENVAALLGRGLERVLGDLAALGFDAEWHCIPASAVGAPHRRDRVWVVAHSALMFCNGSNNNGGRNSEHSKQISESGNGSCPANMAHANKSGLQGLRRQQVKPGAPRFLGGRLIGNFSWWITEPNVGRVADGVPARVDRLRSLGNAVVPQIPEIIGRAIMESERETI